MCCNVFSVEDCLELGFSAPERASMTDADAPRHARSSPSTSMLPFAHLTALGGARARSTATATATAAPTYQEDCLSCRILGTSACGIGAAVVIWEIYKEPRRALSHRYAMGAFAAAFVALGAYRAVL